MGEEEQDGSAEDDRGDRDRERSHEAHWKVAQAGAEEADEPKRRTPNGQETPVPNGEDVSEPNS